MWQYNNTHEELYHVGVLGMKWGKRKAAAALSEQKGKGLTVRQANKAARLKAKEAKKKERMDRDNEILDARKKLKEKALAAMNDMKKDIDSTVKKAYQRTGKEKANAVLALIGTGLMLGVASAISIKSDM